jgi:hypothetical protein
MFKETKTKFFILSFSIVFLLVFTLSSCNFGLKCSGIDKNSDHLCDDCGGVISLCYDSDKNHKCDV